MTRKEASDWHKKIAANRSDKWLKNVREGRRNSRLNPSKLAIARDQKSLYQSDVAKKLGFSEGKYQSIERGRVPVSSQVAKSIAQILNVNWKNVFRPIKHDKYVAILSKAEI